MKQVLSLLFIIVVIAQFQVFTVGCANIIPPTGGPRDSLAPVLLRANPKDSTRNFTGKRIVLEFDEFVAPLDNVQENLVVSPVPKQNPVITPKLRTVTINIKDTLEANTTYSINFGKSLKDVNEGNVAKEFTYVFSTGPYIDSLTLSGKVIDAETGKPDSTLTVVLHKNTTDSAVMKERPRYITKSDNTGGFTFHHLPPGTFALYAFKDEGGQHKYMSKSQLFAFADTLVNTAKTNQSFTLYAYTEKEEEDTSKKTAPVLNRTNVRKDKDAATAQDKRLRIETNLSGQDLDLLGNFELSFKAAPLRNFDSSKVRFTTDKFEPIKGYTLSLDTSKKKATLKYAWVENTPYRLILDKDFAEDTLGHKLIRTDTVEFRTKKQSDYGLVRLRFLNLDLTKNPVLQFVQGDAVKFSHVFTDRNFSAPLFTPGEYDLRIVYDTNKNGIWDSGQFFGKHLQPERVQSLPRKLTIKPNWDNEIDFTL
jgi:uncharacterized protein (DUF2141 family)